MSSVERYDDGVKSQRLLHIPSVGPVLREVDWNEIPYPFVDTILSTLRQEHRGFCFDLVGWEGRGVILCSPAGSKLSRMIEEGALLDEIAAEIATYLKKQIPKEPTRKVDFAWIFNM